MEVITMKVSISRITDKPIELIYKSYRLCYSKNAPQEIKIPMRESLIRKMKFSEIGIIGSQEMSETQRKE